MLSAVGRDGEVSAPIYFSEHVHIKCNAISLLTNSKKVCNAIIAGVFVRVWKLSMHNIVYATDKVTIYMQL